MFDGASETPRDEAPELVEMRRRYDGLLADPPVALDETAHQELLALALIYDLDADQSPDLVWRDVRAVLSRQRSVDDGEPETEGDAATPASRPLTLMVVEDDPEAAADLVEVLVDAGHGVVGPFADAASAMTAAGLHSLDLALLDINLAGEGDGVGLARTLKETWGVPVMFLSGDVTAAARNATLATALVLKPYRGSDVLAAVDRATANGEV